MTSINRGEEFRQVLDVKQLMKEAQDKAGLSDYGDLDFVIGLGKLLDSAATEVNFHAAGLKEFREEVIRDLVNRLRFQHDLKRYPQILEEDISDPIIILGLPRSGTTKTQRMMGTDPSLFNTRMWQILNPAPFPNAVPGQPDPRIAAAAQGDSLLVEANPDVNAAHHMAAESLEEYWNLTEFTFNDWYQNCRNPLPSFADWVMCRDKPSDLANYQYVKALLQYLQWQQGGRSGKRWLLKGCGELSCLGELVEVFPKATIVHIHRHPRACVASLAKLLHGVWSLRVSDVDPVMVGRIILDWEMRSVDKYLETRDRLSLSDRIFDVQYSQIRNNPISIVREVYRRAGHPFSAEAEQGMRGWEKDNEQGKHGQHRYSLEEFGLTGQMVDQAFAEYIRRFN